MTATLTCPAWVLEQLHREGLPVDRHRGTITTHRRERATPRWHPCGQPVYTGTAWPWNITLDPTPTTVDGELFAILTGRATVHIDRRGGMHRRRRRLEYTNADNECVYVEHSCGGPFPIPNPVWAPAPKPISDIPPPF